MTRTRVVNAGVVLVLALLAGWIAYEVLVDQEEASTDGPVIANEDANGYNTALVSGPLALTDGCLTIKDFVAVFPYGTSWDEDAQAVEFGGDFDDADPVAVGEDFHGGGGYYEGNARSGFVDVVQEAVNACLDATGLRGAVLAHPE